jgi:hypothetical protein
MRLKSESRQPGMQGHRLCSICGMPLDPLDGIRCMDCRPRLSDAAHAATRKRKELENADREVESLHRLITRVERRIK